MNPSWFEHVDLVSALLVACFLALIWFIVRTLNKIDTNQTLLFEKQNAMAAELNELKGEHKTMMNVCPARKAGQ